MHTHSRLTRAVAWIAISAFSTQALALPIDLATSPLVTGIGKTVAPNIFFILDDSLSMNSEYMPDYVNDDNDNNGDNDYTEQKRACTLNFGYNTIYYNPNTTYVQPKNSDGTNRSYVPTFSSALPNGFAAASGTNVAVNLGSTTPVYGDITLNLPNNAFATTNSGTTTQRRRVTVTHSGHPFGAAGSTATVRFTGTPTSGNIGGINWNTITNQTFTITVINSSSYYFSQGTTATSTATGGGGSARAVYNGVIDNTPNYFYYRHTANPTAPPSTCASDGSYTKVVPSTAADQANFAVWFSYYRTRLLMMKASAGRAFVGLNGEYRVGYTTISEKGTATAKFLDIKKFDTTHKGDWYAKLYGSSGSSFTPLRAALSKAGRYYAGKFADASGNRDPIQFSCQKNFTILTTDGFWNTNDESPNSDTGTIGAATANYGPFQMDNVTRVGDQDGDSAIARPFRDSSTAANTLADVAYYYYNTDLRPTSGSLGGLADDGTTRTDVSTNNVPATSSDPATHQHMTTFTLGLGVDGSLANPGDYAALLSGSKNWPNPMTSSGATQEARRIDDLWHAAVNGRGTTTNGGSLSAKNPDAVVSELSKALQAITAVVGSSSAAATSNLQPVDGDNTAFIAQFKTVEWSGDLVARVIDVVTGAIPTTNTWSAKTLLGSMNPMTERNIYTYNPSDTTAGRKSFVAANLTTEISANYFKSDSTNPGGELAQYAGWSTAQRTAADSTAMINFIRGVRTNEGTGTGLTQLFRQRESVLGDIVSAAPVFVRKPPFAYTDGGYAAFIAGTAIANRAATVYVGANDGMLHAFDGTTGQTNSGKERWAYIPKLVLKNLHKLAASDYSVNHRFYVDGPITVGDAYSTTASAWSTILVGGLGGGGKGYYALDVTDPTNPKVLWEFGNTSDYTGDTSYDSDMGFSYGNPVITKRASDGRWVVLFASGYNNSIYNATTNPTATGDAQGRLFVVDAFTGQKLSEIVTSTAANEDLSGISRIANFVTDGLRNNTTQYVYAGDLGGALWRFDISAGSVVKLGSTSSTPGAQPITVQPELATIKTGTDTHTVVYFGTGRYLGTGDLSTGAPSTSTAQAIYAVKDTGADIGVLTTSGANLVGQTLNTGTNPRTSTSSAVDWATQNGWYVTTPVGERFNVDPGLQLGTLVIAANIPAADYCKPTGSSILYQLSYKNGQVLRTNAFSAQIVGTTQLQLGGSGGSSGSVHGGKVVIESVLADGTTVNTDQINSGGAAGTAVRVSWREIE